MKCYPTNISVWSIMFYHLIYAIYCMSCCCTINSVATTTCAFRIYSPPQAGKGWLCKSGYFDYRSFEFDVVSASMTVCVSVCAPALPDVEGAFLTGAQGAWSWAHAAVHHLLPQVVDLGLKATILCIGGNKQHKLCQQDSKNRSTSTYYPPLGFKFDTPKVKVVLNDVE